jgi:adenine deaminase
LIDEHPDQVMLCSDDMHPDELLLGHINQLAARAVKSGRDLMNILQTACINPVEHYSLDVGMLRVGDPADFIVVNDLTDFRVEETYLDGTLVAKGDECLMPKFETEVINNFVASLISVDQLNLPGKSDRVHVIDAIDGQLITNRLVENCIIENGNAVPDVDNDILKIVVVNRYKQAEPSIAFVKGFGLKSGAFASSVAHDSHNVVAVGTNDSDLTAAINAVIDSKGGLSVSDSGQTDVLPLPVAGLMSTESCESVGNHYSQLNERLNQIGVSIRSPFMTLSFMALLVIPSLKISDKGLFDGNKFEITNLFVD